MHLCQFILLDNDGNGIKAKSKHSVLELTIPKVEKSQAKQINVESEE